MISSENFLPSPSFNGSRLGYSFKSSELGLGYYKDNNPNNPNSEVLTQLKLMKLILMDGIIHLN